MRKINSLESEVICSQPGVVDLQDHPVVVSGGFQDLQNTERVLWKAVPRKAQLSFLTVHEAGGKAGSLFFLLSIPHQARVGETIDSHSTGNTHLEHPPVVMSQSHRL